MNAETAENARFAPPAKQWINLKINDKDVSIEVAPWVTLLDLLRERLELTGTKKGCDHGQCGACTVLVDGKRINSCLTLAVMKDGASITTIQKAADLIFAEARGFEHNAFKIELGRRAVVRALR